MSATATEKKVATTTYLVLSLTSFDEGGDGWVKVGEYTVPAGRRDKAEQLALTALAAAHPDEESFTLASTSTQSWKEETFQLEPPAAPKFKPVTG